MPPLEYVLKNGQEVLATIVVDKWSPPTKPKSAFDGKTLAHGPKWMTAKADDDAAAPTDDPKT
jgi:hypothetical protein